MGTFKAWVIDKGEAGQSLAFRDFDESELMDGDVTVRVTHSTLNYKDGLALTGTSPVVRRFPDDPRDRFLRGGRDLGSPGVQAGRRRRPHWLGRRRDASRRLRAARPGQGRLAGAAARGPQPRASHGDRYRGLYRDAVPDGPRRPRADAGTRACDRHRGVGRRRLGGGGAPSPGRLARDRLHGAGRRGRLPQGPRQPPRSSTARSCPSPASRSARSGGAAGIDAVGSTTLANVLAQTRSDGAVAACGLAQGMDLPTSVAPFILRGVSRLGINSVTTPQTKRRAAWARLARELDLDKLASHDAPGQPGGGRPARAGDPGGPDPRADRGGGRLKLLAGTLAVPAALHFP